MSTRQKGARLIIVDGEKYYWRVPRRANNDQQDHSDGLFAIVWNAKIRGAKLRVDIPHPHPASWSPPAVVPILPSDIACGIREALSRGWEPKQPGRLRYAGKYIQSEYKLPDVSDLSK